LDLGKRKEASAPDVPDVPEQFRRIPIVVLTISANEEDIFRSYALQGNCYVIKSSDLDQLFQIVKRIEEFWLGIVTLPLEELPIKLKVSI
jgi:DNA-binding NarL/FixJ family response regulator